MSLRSRRNAESRIHTVTNGSVVTTYVYDAAGRRVRKTVGSVTTDYLYNLAGQAVTEINGSGATITMNYLTPGTGGNMSVSAASTTTQTQWSFPGGSFSGSGALSLGSGPHGSDLAHPLVTTYGYDLMDRLIAVSQAAGPVNGQQQPGQPRSYQYDSLGRLLTSTTPESGTVTKYYTTAAGGSCAGDPTLVCRTVDARGVVKNLSYDTINRISGVSYTNDPAGTAALSYHYDAGGLAAFALDRLTSINEGANSQTFTYDNLGRITLASNVIDSVTYPVHYGYNSASQLASITYPSGRVVNQNYDVVGRIQSVASGGTSYLTVNTYNAAMQPTAVSYGNQVQGAFGYNDHLQLQSLRYFKTGASSDILNLGYDYSSATVTGNNGQIQAIHYYTSPGVEDQTKSEAFTYDNWGRLSEAQTLNLTATGTWKLDWTYDRLGNRLTQTLTGGTVSIGQPQFTVDQNTNHIVGYSYDAAGNMTHDASVGYGYDGAGRMISTNNGSTPAAYTYFGALRIKKVVGATTTITIYSGTQPIAEYAPGAALSSP